MDGTSASCSTCIPAAATSNSFWWHTTSTSRLQCRFRTATTSSCTASSNSIRRAPSSIGLITTREDATRRALSRCTARRMNEGASSQRAPLSVALASRSPRRRQLLESLGLDVVEVPSSYDESAHAYADPREMVLEHARGKAALATPNGPPLLVAADTDVVIDGEVLGKPRDATDAAAMLRLLSGRTHVVHTGFALLDRARAVSFDGVESAHVTFLELDGEHIECYVASGEPLDKAGAYGIQGRGALLVASIDGDFYTVMGLPLARLGRAFASLGYDLL